MEHSNDFLGTERVGRLMGRYAVPCVISLLVGALYNIVDQIFIANADYLGSYGNAANTVVFPLTVVALAIAVMVGDGCCAFVSMALGPVFGQEQYAQIPMAVVGIVMKFFQIVISAVIIVKTCNSPIISSKRMSKSSNLSNIFLPPRSYLYLLYTPQTTRSSPAKSFSVRISVKPFWLRSCSTASLWSYPISIYSHPPFLKWPGASFARIR